MPKRNFWTFPQALRVSRNLGLGNSTEWRLYSEGKIQAPHSFLECNFPKHPQLFYQEWTSWEDWLGDSYSRTKKRLQFEEAKRFVHQLGLSSSVEWKLYVAHRIEKRIRFDSSLLPKHPDQYYKETWTSWEDWLGASYAPYRQGLMSYANAKAFVSELGISSAREYFRYIDGEQKDRPIPPCGLPKYPQVRYRGRGWLSWNDWLKKSPYQRKEGQSSEMTNELSFDKLNNPEEQVVLSEN